MNLNHQTLSGSDIAGALAWWRDAGVDLDLRDAAQPWIAEPEAIESEPVAEPIQPASVPRVRIGGDPAELPATLEGFAEWWLSEPSLDGGMVQSRIQPRGPAGAEAMILVPHPEADDRESLLSGPQGKLLDAMLSAMGLAPEVAYFASVLPRHTPHPDWTALHAGGIDAVLARHIALAAPQRLIVFGGIILPLLGHDPAKTGQNLLQFNHEGRSIPMLAAMDLGVFLTNPRRKASFWQRWLDWTG